ncbi:hypothetical protein OJE16_07600 [Pantoea tagorei]
MKLKALALAAMTGALALPLSALADELPNGPHVVTSGQATVDARPDIATLSIVVNVSSKDAADAKKTGRRPRGAIFRFPAEKRH